MGLLGLAVAWGCGTEPTALPPISAIVGGELAGDRYSEVGALVLTSDRTVFCSGVLISPTVFLSAGHCVFFWVEEGGLAHGDYAVTFDSPVTATSPYVLATAYKHPDWEIVEPITENFTINHDVGVFVLDEPVRNIKPAKLPERNILDGLNRKGKLTHKRFDTAGYGCINYIGFLDCEGAGTRRVANQGFLELMSDHDHLRLDVTQGGSCYYDSGGPHYFAGTHIIVSITSGGDATCETIDETTRIDTPSALRFLKRFMRERDDGRADDDDRDDDEDADRRHRSDRQR